MLAGGSRLQEMVTVCVMEGVQASGESADETAAGDGREASERGGMEEERVIGGCNKLMVVLYKGDEGRVGMSLGNFKGRSYETAGNSKTHTLNSSARY